jgi:glycolate oxidase
MSEFTAEPEALSTVNTTPDVVALLIEDLGHLVTQDVEELENARADKSGHVSIGPPLCVVFAETTDHVATVLRIAHNTHTPVVTRGGGSGLAGGAIGSPGEIVLSLERMNRILEISVEDRWAVVEAGVINDTLNEAAKERGLWFAPDPASRPWSTVGGNIATNAGGLLCVKYGVTREAVLDLTVVLPGGEIMRVGHKSVKGVTGFDLAALFVGSEGTLGVITQATVALKPLDSSPVWTISGFAEDIETVTRAVSDTITGRARPAILELIDQRAADHIARFLDRAHLPSGVTHLIAQTDGPSAKGDAQQIADIWTARGLTVEVGENREDLIAFRRAMHPAMESAGQVLIEDVAVPRSKLTDMFAAIRRIEQEFAVEIPTVAHAGDGNLHPNFIYTGDTVPDHIWKAADALFREALVLGGTLTGEHGVGLLKRQWLKDELGDVQWRMQWGIKKLFDPHNILNPGKVFHPDHH